MTCEDLIAYLSSFEPREDVSFVIADVKKRLHHKVSNLFLIEEMPAIMLETAETEPLEDINCPDA
jgi:hypothetical protein